MGDRKYGLITEEDIQNIHVMSEYNFDNATESRSAAAGAAGGAAGAAGGAAGGADDRRTEDLLRPGGGDDRAVGKTGEGL